MKKIAAYETSDGMLFTGQNAHKEAKQHEDSLSKKTTYLRMKHEMMNVLGISTDDGPCQDEFAEMMDMVVNIESFEDSFNLIVNIIAMLGYRLPELVSVFNRYNGTKLLGSEEGTSDTRYKWNTNTGTYVDI